MSSTGLRSSIHIAMLLVAVPFPTAVAQTDLTQDTRSTGRSGEHQSDQAASVFATQPGVGIGFSVGFDGQASSVTSSIQNSVGYEVYLRYGTSFGPFLRGGIHISTHEIDGANPTYKLTSFFLEPQFVALKLSSLWAPFVSGRLALVKEAVDSRGASFRASGYSLGGGAGALFYLASQVALEGSFSVGVAKLNDYVFGGEAAWYGCLERVSSGTSLPESVILCDGSSKTVQYHAPDGIPYADSGRSITWYQVRLGIQLSLTSQ